MQPICILCNFVFFDVIPHQNSPKLHLFTDLRDASKSCIGLPVIHHSLYVMCEGLPVTQKTSKSHIGLPVDPRGLYVMCIGLPVM